MSDGAGDFVSFGMKNSCAELSYDVGSGPGVIRSDPLALNKWHNVRMTRDKKKGDSLIYHSSGQRNIFYIFCIFLYTV